MPRGTRNRASVAEKSRRFEITGLQYFGGTNARRGHLSGAGWGRRQIIQSFDIGQAMPRQPATWGQSCAISAAT
jgi:hypothetical protein